MFPKPGLHGSHGAFVHFRAGQARLTPMWILRADEGSPTGPLTFRVSPGAVKTIGRAPTADFPVDAPLVSRVHCRLAVSDADQLEVTDLDSTNGTFVNGRRIERAALVTGDRLQVGRVEFTVDKDEKKNEERKTKKQPTRIK